MSSDPVNPAFGSDDEEDGDLDTSRNVKETGGQPTAATDAPADEDEEEEDDEEDDEDDEEDDDVVCA